MAGLRSAETKITRARDKLGVEKNHRLIVEDSFAATLEEAVSKKVAKVVELTQIWAEEGKKAFEMATTDYLASDAFQVVKAGCFLEGFENFWEIAAEVYLD